MLTCTLIKQRDCTNDCVDNVDNVAANVLLMYSGTNREYCNALSSSIVSTV